MGTRITVAQREGLKDLASALNKPLTEVIEMAVSRVLDGSTPLPIKDIGPKVEVSVYLPYEKEQALRALSKQTEVSLEEIYRVAIRGLLASSQALIDKAHELAIVQEAQLKRKNTLISRNESLMARREALMAKEEDPEDEDLDEPNTEDGGPRAYSGHRKPKHR
jgi:hypothetical protein